MSPAANGEVVFTTIYPGWYMGRATHIHVEVTMGGRSVKATQIAFPETINPTSNLADGIFADSLSSELVTASGSPSSGYAATWQVGVSI